MSDPESACVLSGRTRGGGAPRRKEGTAIRNPTCHDATGGGTDLATASLPGGVQARGRVSPGQAPPRSEGGGRADPSALPSIPGRREIVRMVPGHEVSATRHVARANKLRVLPMCEDAHTDAHGASANVAVGTQQRRLNAEPISTHRQYTYDGNAIGSRQSRFE